MTLQEQIAVMQAALEGKTIELRVRGAGHQPDLWSLVPIDNIGKERYWNWFAYEFRVKPPDPRVVYISDRGLTNYNRNSDCNEGILAFRGPGKDMWNEPRRKFVEVVE
jgi:hypothetical protein